MKVNKEYVYLATGGIIILVVTATLLVFKKKKKSTQSIDWSIFDSPDAPGSGKCMDKRLVNMLLQLERLTQYPILKNINSAARTHAHNSKVGGVHNSSHKIPICKAVDIRTPTRAIQQRLVMAARKIGFKRIGIGKTFVHLDIDESKSQFVAWGYPSGTRPPFNPFV